MKKSSIQSFDPFIWINNKTIIEISKRDNGDKYKRNQRKCFVLFNLVQYLIKIRNNHQSKIDLE